MPGTLTRVSWTPPADLSIEDYFAAIEKFSLVESCVQWWIGDALQSMETKYGETWSQVLPDSTVPGFDSIKKRLENYKWVAGKVKNSLRKEFLTWSHHLKKYKWVAGKVKKSTRVEFLSWTHHLKKYKWVAGKVKKLLRSNFLSWSHHYEVAKLDEEAQSALLKRAAAEHLSVRALHEAIHGAPDV